MISKLSISYMRYGLQAKTAYSGSVLARDLFNSVITEYSLLVIVIKNRINAIISESKGEL